jgi:hypothetical protein
MPLSKAKRQAAYDQVAAAIAENKARKAAYAQRAASTFGVSEVGKNGRLTIKQKLGGGEPGRCSAAKLQGVLRGYGAIGWRFLWHASQDRIP